MSDFHALHGLIDQIPEDWTLDERNRWAFAFTNLLDYCVPVSDPLGSDAAWVYDGAFAEGTECFARPGLLGDGFVPVVVTAPPTRDSVLADEPTCTVRTADGRSLLLFAHQLSLVEGDAQH